jgi:hypothetical protein
MIGDKNLRAALHLVDDHAEVAGRLFDVHHDHSRKRFREFLKRENRNYEIRTEALNRAQEPLESLPERERAKMEIDAAAIARDVENIAVAHAIVENPLTTSSEVRNWKFLRDLSVKRVAAALACKDGSERDHLLSMINGDENLMRLGIRLAEVPSLREFVVGKRIPSDPDGIYEPLKPSVTRITNCA